LLLLAAAPPALGRPGSLRSDSATRESDLLRAASTEEGASLAPRALPCPLRCRTSSSSASSRSTCAWAAAAAAAGG
jgi:hypothetical protein